jgi:hypothetical protein
MLFAHDVVRVVALTCACRALFCACRRGLDDVRLTIDDARLPRLPPARARVRAVRTCLVAFRVRGLCVSSPSIRSMSRTRSTHIS